MATIHPPGEKLSPRNVRLVTRARVDQSGACELSFSAPHSVRNLSAFPLALHSADGLGRLLPEHSIVVDSPAYHPEPRPFSVGEAGSGTVRVSVASATRATELRTTTADRALVVARRLPYALDLPGDSPGSCEPHPGHVDTGRRRIGHADALTSPPPTCRPPFRWRRWATTARWR